MWIKILLMAGIAAVALVILRGSRGARHQALRRLMLLVFAGFAVLSLLFPTIWAAMARAVGVGRGTDLLLYGLIIAFLGYVATSYLRFRDLETQLTVLTRRLALDEVALPGGRPESAHDTRPLPGLPAGSASGLRPAGPGAAP